MGETSPKQLSNFGLPPLNRGDTKFTITIPSAIEDIADPAIKERASEVYRQAYRIFRCDRVFRRWADELEATGDADPVVMRNVINMLKAGIRSITQLCSAEFTPSLREVPSDALVANLPEYPILAGWQRDKCFSPDALREQARVMNPFVWDCAKIVTQMEYGPVAVLADDKLKQDENNALTKPLMVKEAARWMSDDGKVPRSPSETIKRLISSNRLRPPLGKGRYRHYYLGDFPPQHRDKVKQ